MDGRSRAFDDAPEDIVVAGLGPSIQRLVEAGPDNFYTIGINDIDRHFAPRHLFVIDAPSTFQRRCPEDPTRCGYIENTGAKDAWISQPWIFQAEPGPRVHRVETHTARTTDPDIDDDPIPQFMTSAYAASVLAYRFGAKRIGLIGVDLTNHKFLSKPQFVQQISSHFKGLNMAFEKRGVQLFNCSDESDLLYIPHAPLESFQMVPS